ncbi:hypothetical protein OsI_07786 [Oryza sativa Indica Group]|uniref:Uncharacterized protein n=1 Tax=Oryza sativa subsp. indica TaxID=39946 RepID=A2X6E8_ORYSI|nr:hypothetical protein OsI_07786 [Oryza sativa Indica Group]
MGRVWGGLSWNGPALNPRLLHPAPAPGAVAGPNQPPLGPRCRRRQRQSLAAPLARRLTALALRCPAHRRVEEEGRGARGRRLACATRSPACRARTLPVALTVRRSCAARHAARPPPCEDRRDWERGEREIGGQEGRRVEREMERRTGVLATAAKE